MHACLRPLTVGMAATGIALACSEPTGPTVVLPTTVEATGDSVRLSAIGESAVLTAAARRGSRPISAAMLWFSAADSIATVSLTGRVTARGAGATRLYVVSDSGGIDSVLVRVAQQSTRLRFTATRASLMVDRSFQFVAAAADSGGNLSGESVTPLWSVTPETRASVSASGLVTAISEGLVTVRAVAGPLSAETTLVVTPVPALRFTHDTLRLARLLVRSADPFGALLTADSATADFRASVTLTVSDTSIARATQRIGLPYTNPVDSTLQFVGRNVGVTLVRASAPGWEDAIAVLVVEPPRLRIVGPDTQRVLPDGGARADFVLLDGEGVQRTLAAEHWFDVASSDTTIAMPEFLSVPAGPSKGGVAFVRTRLEGTATVVIGGAGFNSDTVTLHVQARDLLFRPSAEFDAGFMRGSVNHQRRFWIGTTHWVPDSLRVTIAQQAPDVVQLSSNTGLIRIGGFEPQFTLVGLAEGVDTLVVSAPGMRDDTLVVEIGRPRYAPWFGAPKRANLLQATSLSVGITDSLETEVFYVLRAGTPTTFRIISSDTSIVRATELGRIDVNELAASVGLEFLRDGAVSLRVEDPDGSYLPLELGTFTVEPARLRLGESYLPRGGFEMGLGTATAVEAMPDDPYTRTVAGNIVTSDTTILRVSGSSGELPGNVRVSSTGVAGDVWLSSSGPGIVSDSILVRVRGIPRVASYSAGPQVANWTEPDWGAVFLVDGSGRFRQSADSITFRLRSSDTTRVQVLDSLIVLEAGGYFSENIGIQARAPGWAAVIVEDTRPPGARLDPISIGVEILQAGTSEQSVEAKRLRDDIRAEVASQREFIRCLAASPARVCVRPQLSLLVR